VENGRIVGAVTETMINGNLEGVFKNVVAVSREQVCDGSSVLPYLACSGIVISGK
jgi:PmbA protein